MTKPAQCKFFDFKRHWAKKVKPHLQDPQVQGLLNYGMQNWVCQRNIELIQMGSSHRWSWEPGDCPYRLSGDLALHPRWPRDGSYRWYQPFGKCHWIAPFLLGLAKKIYPKDSWYIQRGYFHTTVTNTNKTIVFDILLFERGYTPRQALIYAGDYPETRAERLYIDIIERLESLEQNQEAYADKRYRHERVRTLTSRLKIIESALHEEAA